MYLWLSMQYIKQKITFTYKWTPVKNEKATKMTLNKNVTALGVNIRPCWCYFVETWRLSQHFSFLQQCGSWWSCVSSWGLASELACNFFWHCINQGNLKSQSRFKRWGNRLSFLSKKSMLSECKEDPRSEELQPYLQYTTED